MCFTEYKGTTAGHDKTNKRLIKIASLFVTLVHASSLHKVGNLPDCRSVRDTDAPMDDRHVGLIDA